MIANGIYRLTIVAVDLCQEGLRIEFDLDLEDDRISKVFSLAPPAASLRFMLGACGKYVPRRRVRLHLDKLVGLDCSGMVIGGHVIEFFSMVEATFWPPWFLTFLNEQVPNYLM